MFDDFMATPAPAWRHRVLGTDLSVLDDDPSAADLDAAIVGAGCFWGVEKLLWGTPGVIYTAPGYAGGTYTHPDYRMVCTGATGHAEVVLVVFDPSRVLYADLVRLILENHDPTQGDRQGNDVGTQYRSILMPRDDAQEATARELLAAYAPKLAAAGFGPVTTEVKRVSEPAVDGFHIAEEPHRQYLDANPWGYCPVHATGVRCG